MSDHPSRQQPSALRRMLPRRLGDAPSPYAVAVLVGSFAVYLVIHWLKSPSMIDVMVYRAEGSALWSGHDLYGPLEAVRGLLATYPPFAAMLFVPLAALPLDILRTAAVLVNLGLLVVVALLSCRLVGIDGRSRTNAVLVLAGLAVWSEPVYTTLGNGQINLLLLVLVLFDVTRPATSRTRGVALGIATGIKVTPGLLIVYLLLTRRFRMAGVAAGSFAATIAVSALVTPDATWRFWTRLLFDTGRVGRPENEANQSIRGVLVRIEHSRTIAPAWTLLVAAVLVVGLLVAVFAYRRLGDRWGVPACALTSLLVAPISWSHHWVWCVPIALLLWHEARRWVWTLAVFWTFAVWAVPHEYPSELHFSTWQILLSMWYVAFGFFFLGLSVLAARRAGSAPPETTTRAT